MMAKGTGILALVACLAWPVAAVSSQATGQLSTVNSYTPAQEGRARVAAKRAGYTPGPVLFAQDGNFFFNATKDGGAFELTITPRGQVYGSKSEN